MKIEKLTKEQEALIPIVREEWLSHFFSLEFDEQKARELINWIYEDLLKLKKPMIFILNSPFACQIAINFLKRLLKNKNLFAQVRAQVGAQVRAQVGAQIWEQVRAQVGAQVGKQVGAQVGAQVGKQVGAQVWAQVWEQVGAQVGKQVGAQVGAQVWEQVGAQVRAQVGDQVGDQVGEQVREQVWEQVWEQVRAQVGVQVRAQVWEQVRAQVWEQVGAQVWEQVGAQVRAQVGAQVREQVRDQVGAQVWEQVGAQVWEQVRAQVWEQVGAQVRTQVWEQVRAQVGVQVREQDLEYFSCCWRGCSCYDFNWVSFYDFFERINVNVPEIFKKYKQLIKCNSFYLITLQNFVFISKPPRFMKRDEHIMHSINSKAIEFEDGWGLYYVQGVHFSEQDFSKYFIETPTAKKILEMRNQEQKAVVINHIGYDSLASELELEELSRHVDTHQKINILYTSRHLPINLIKARDSSTDRVYYLGVPREIKDCLEALAWTFNLAREEYTERLES